MDIKEIDEPSVVAFDQLEQQPKKEKESNDIREEAELEEVEGDAPRTEEQNPSKTVYAVRDRQRENEKIEIGQAIANDQASQHDAAQTSWKEALKQAVALWLKVNWHKIHVLSAIVLFMCVYYLPAILLTSKLLDDVEGILYGIVLIFMMLSALWVSLGLALIEIFSFQFTKNAILFALIPGFIIHLGIVIFVSNPIFRGNMTTLSTVFFLGLGFYLVQKSKKPDDLTHDQEEYYILTKDGTVLALTKSVTLFLLTNILMSNILGIYLKSSFFTKLVLRFIIFPVAISFMRWIQMKFIQKLSTESMDKRMVINKMSIHYIRLVGRSLVSSLSMNSALSYEFILANFASSVIEISSTITFEHRMKLFYKLQYRIAKIYSFVVGRTKTKRLVSVIPENDMQNSNNRVNHGNKPSEQVRKEMEFVQESTKLRTKQIFDDIMSEIHAIISIPLLMYFIHPLIPYASFQSITSFKECIYQIIIQLFFEIISDIFSLSYEIRNGRLKMNDVENWKPLGNMLYLSLTIFCLTVLNRVIILLY